MALPGAQMGRLTPFEYVPPGLHDLSCPVRTGVTSDLAIRNQPQGQLASILTSFHSRTW